MARARGWVFLGQIPEVPKMIVVGAPHTSNWDFVLFLAALHHFRIDVRYLGKHTLFRWPIGRFFLRTGGIPVDRSQPNGAVARAAAEFEASEGMILVIAPEGTRRLARWWRSGFLSIAERADVPIVLAAIDSITKTITLGKALRHDGDVSGFMEAARRFYADKRGLRPGLEGPVAVRSETDPA